MALYMATGMYMGWGTDPELSIEGPLSLSISNETPYLYIC